MLLGDEGRNNEVHVHATFISVLRDNDFLDHDVLARTCPQGTQNRPHSYAHYSGMLTPEITQLNENAIRTVYQCDVMANRLDGSYMGIWQFHHISEAFKQPIGCVYPQRTNQTLHKDMNRIIVPISCVHNMKRPVMWTPIHLDDHHSEVIHFVALLKKVNNINVITAVSFLIPLQ